MPIVHVELLEGRSQEQLKKLGEAITAAIVEHADAPASAVSIVFTEMRHDRLMQNGKFRSDTK